MKNTLECDLMIIGTGMSGMAATLFAIQSGLSTVHTGQAGEFNFASGLLDLMAVHPIVEKKTWENPWDGIAALKRDLPGHPLARIPADEIRESLDKLTAFLDKGGLTFTGHPDRNVRVMTPAGTLKRTYRVPLSMWKGVQAAEEKRPCLIADFHGLKGFSSRQIAESLKAEWPDLRAVRVTLPGLRGEAYPRHLGRTMETPEMKKALIQALKPHLGNEKTVGLPALMGIRRTQEMMESMEEVLGVDLFEIPTMPPSLPGFRIREVFEKQLPALGAETLYQQQVLNFERKADGDFVFDVGHTQKEFEVRSKGVILASGRFFGKGLRAERKRIRETVFDLPVVQPEKRSLWHNRDFWASEGHPVNQAGLAVDERFRPVDADGNIVYENLHAAGAILAYQDWMRMKCGSGLAVATAYAAVEAFAEGAG